MAKPVYKMFMVHLSEAWYQLSAEAQNSLLHKVEAARNSVGGKVVVFCDSSWASDMWGGFGVEEFPDIDAAQKYAVLLNEFNWFRYTESITLLGTQFQSDVSS